MILNNTRVKIPGILLRNLIFCTETRALNQDRTKDAEIRRHPENAHRKLDQERFLLACVAEWRSESERPRRPGRAAREQPRRLPRHGAQRRRPPRHPDARRAGSSAGTTS